MVDTDLAWAAGIIDGEGCIQIAKRSIRLGSGYTLSVTVNMTHEATIQRLRDIFGFGSILHLETSHKRKQWRWALGSKQADIMLRMVRRYLVTKAKEADIALDFRRFVPTTGVKVTPESHANRVRCYQEMQEAKHGTSMEPFFRHRPNKRVPRHAASPSNQTNRTLLTSVRPSF